MKGSAARVIHLAVGSINDPPRRWIQEATYHKVAFCATGEKFQESSEVNGTCHPEAWEPQGSRRQGSLYSEAAAHRTIPRLHLLACLRLDCNLRTGAESRVLGAKAKLSGKRTALHSRVELIYSLFISNKSHAELLKQ